MTPQEELKEKIKEIAIEFGADPNDDDIECSDEWCDAQNEVRCMGEETELEASYSRHYESKQVAMKCKSGNWVSWTYWYGGGKHGQPGEIDWIEDAFYVKCTEEEKVVTVRTFVKERCDERTTD